MKRKARIFSPDTIKTQICQAVRRDLEAPLHEYGDDQSPRVLLRQRLAKEIDKKYKSFESVDESTRILAFIKFLNVNEHMQSFNLDGLDLPDEHVLMQTRRGLVPQSTDEPRVAILLRARALMHSVLSPFTEDEWFQCCKHGTGVSIGVSYSDTSLEAKSKWPISVSERAFPLLRRYLEYDHMAYSAQRLFNERCPTGQWYAIANESRATTVPKNDVIDRMIAVEPTGNMFLQQGLMEMMYRRMKHHGLDLESLPTQHKERARSASLDGSDATIDWSSASDCMSIDLLRWLLPPVWFECCDLVRSTHILIEDTRVELNMFSTMGNAVTFPLETLVFWTLAHACRLEIEGKLTCYPEWDDLLTCSVFGDDCIVPTPMALPFIRMMESVGFICNEEKSFYADEGFRESCGGDYLRGYDVRPAYIKQPHSNKLSALEPWLYIIANRILPKYISCFGERDYVYCKEFLELWFSYFREYKLELKLVPPGYPDDSGLAITEDIQRLIACYPALLSRVGRDHHGSYTFRFLRFQYRKGVTRFDELHYAAWLKRPGGERSPWWETKKIGGYVVAKGRSAHWTLPSVYN